MCQSCGWGSGPLDSLFRTSESELQTRLRFVYKPGCITRTSCLLHKAVVARRMCVVVSLTWLIDTDRVTVDNIVSRPTCMFVLSVVAILPQTFCDHTCILRVKMPKNPLAGILYLVSRPNIGPIYFYAVEYGNSTTFTNFNKTLNCHGLVSVETLSTTAYVYRKLRN